MFNGKISLSPEEIYEKDFKVDARGYRPQEVDNFLDEIIKDYSSFIKIIRGQDKELASLTQENNDLRNRIRNLEERLEAEVESGNESSGNVDLLRRISQLEKIVYTRLK